MKHLILTGLIVFTLSHFILSDGFMAAQAESNEIRLVEAGKSDFTIVLSKDASASEKHAAAELQTFLREISGAELPIAVEGQARPGQMIVLGDGETFRSLNAGVDLKDLGDEGFAIQTVGPHLVIVGGRLRGTMYGVYTLLEEQLGCRWYTSTVSYIPKTSTIVLKPLSIVQKQTLNIVSLSTRMPGIPTGPLAIKSTATIPDLTSSGAERSAICRLFTPSTVLFRRPNTSKNTRSIIL